MVKSEPLKVFAAQAVPQAVPRQKSDFDGSKMVEDILLAENS